MTSDETPGVHATWTRINLPNIILKYIILAVEAVVAVVVSGCGVVVVIGGGGGGRGS